MMDMDWREEVITDVPRGEGSLVMYGEGGVTIDVQEERGSLVM